MVTMFLFTLSWGQVCIFPLFECNYDWKLFKFFLRERWKGWRLLFFFFYPFCSQDFIGNSPYYLPYNSKDVSSENLILAQLIILWFIFSFILITFLLDFVSMLCFGLCGSSSKIDPLSQSGNLWLIGSLVLTAALKIQIGHCKYRKKADISNVHPLSELLTLLNP